MSTISEIAIEHSNLDDIVNVVGNTYNIGKRVVKEFSNSFEFLLKTNFKGEFETREDYKGSRTFVIHQERNSNWIQIDYELDNVYEFDEMLRRLTLEFSTKAFIGYNQTTSGDFRFALFENGVLRRSIYQQYISTHGQMRLMDNYGVKLPFETIDLGAPITQELVKDTLLDYEVLNVWFDEIGFSYEEREGLEFLHLEIESFKN